MEFAVLDGSDAKPGVALIGREDLEGLDLQEGAPLRLYRADAPGKTRDVVVQVGKKLRRRVVVLHPTDREALGLAPTKQTDVKPVEVPWLPASERVMLEDPKSPAPGADAFRWFFYAASPPWSATRHSLSNVRALQKEFAVKLRNVYSFFTIYANIDRFDPMDRSLSSTAGSPLGNELDRWILGELATTVEQVTRDLDGYDVYGATQKLTAFVDALSNWYVRRSRARFWRAGALGEDDDKRRAYETLYEALVTITKLTAPFTPFASERMYQNLVVRPAARAKREVPTSVHLCEFPSTTSGWADARLSSKVRTVRDLVSLGLQVRTQAKLKVRQPLHAAHVIVADPALLDKSARAMLEDELNVLETNVYGPRDAARFVEYRLKPNFRTLGQKGLGKQAQELKKKMAAMPSADAAAIAARLMEQGRETFDGVELERADVEIEFVSKEGFAAAGDRAGVVVLETKLDDRLRELGFARELQSRVQAMRKEMSLDFTDRIALAILGSDRVAKIVEATRDELASEVLAVTISTTEAPAGSTSRDVDVEGEKVTIAIARG